MLEEDLFGEVQLIVKLWGLSDCRNQNLVC